jgi:small neutral amino acid transporter SnatA (MarC family)
MSKLVHLLTAIIGMQFILNGTSKVITTILQSR